MTEQDTYQATSLAEEIRLLVEMVIERAAPWLEGIISAGHGPETEQKPHEAGDCGWCPLCALVAVVKGERPEFAAKLMEQAAQLIALLRAVLADRWEPEGGVHMPGFQPAAKPGAAHDDPVPSVRVQHIAVRRRDEWQPDREN
ncbi:hypothetical protein SAMN05421504_10933 [Amycolatopsis xylanica]|uniref:Uncharacterized protein n=2 Tax=Amycolatopsis xylanica TaxID=589385 RepID=A0A1H3Q133_9PSEU|nr:hypothetical protein SAMN05421504_10933 [Amycolatopsis xylanica]